MRLVPRAFDDQRLALRHGTPPYLNRHTRELGSPGVQCRLSCPMPAQDFAGGGVHDLVDGALACHRVSLPEEVRPALGPANQEGGGRPGTARVWRTSDRHVMHRRGSQRALARISPPTEGWAARQAREACQLALDAGADVRGIRGYGRTVAWRDYEREVAGFFSSLGCTVEVQATLQGILTKHNIDYVNRPGLDGGSFGWFLPGRVVRPRIAGCIVPPEAIASL